MNPRPYTAWRFAHPDLDAPEMLSGLSIGPTGDVDMIHEEASIRQSLLLLISTKPGERVMRPGYGCELYKLVFSPNDETSAGLAIYYVRQAILEWEPRIEILRLNAERNPIDPVRLDIFLDYRVRTTKKSDVLTFSLDLSG